MKAHAGWFNRTGFQRINYSYLMAILVLAALLPSLVRGEQSPQTQPTTAAAKQQSLRFRVIDKQTQKPLPDVTLDIHTSCQSKLPSQSTDSQGQAIIALPETLKYLRITAQKDKLVPRSVSWGEKELKVSIPKEYTLALEPGTTIGGVIRNEQGEPIEGVTVFLLVPGGCRDKECVAIRDYPVKTNAEGRWRCDIVPADLDDILIRLSHPDYVSDNHYNATPKPPMEQLRDMTGVLVMKKGLTVKGRVTDQEGNPIPQARVIQGTTRFANFPVAQTNAEGDFEFKNVSPATMVLTVQAKGYAPELKEITVGKETKLVEFSLQPGRTIKGRIVDQNGKPVIGAFVAADTWRGHRSLDWRMDTDSEGRFVWKEAPADEVLFDMGKRGFMSIRRKALTASDEEYVLTLHPSLTIKGTVTDSKTGKPIEAFKVIPGIEWDSRQKSWENHDAQTFQNGKYEITRMYPYPNHILRIEAKGYRPDVSPSFKSNEGAVTFDVKLEKEDWKTGTVLSPEGKPVADADVAVCTPSQRVMVRSGKFERMQTPNILTTNAQGRFAFPPQIEPYKLIVIHDSGCAEISEEQFNASPDIQLKPWGQIEGTVYIGAKPTGEQKVIIHDFARHDPTKPQCHFNYDATTDSNGQFVFKRVFPDKWNAVRGIPHDRGVSFSHGVPVEVKPGKTSHVKIGGTGRPVTGRIVLPEENNMQINWSFGHFGIRTKQKDLSIPEEVKEMSSEEKRKWYETWKDSKEGRTALKAQQEQSRYYSFVVNNDGTFRADDIPAGNYVLDISVHEPPKAGQCGYGEQIGNVRHEFVVPEMDGGRSDEPLDLGTLELKLLKWLKAGTSAPDFEVKTLDGKTLKLSDFKGKYVLLDFWATWCGPCVGETPNLKKVYETFGGDERFVMIGLSLDKQIDDLKQFVTKNELKWHQGFLGEWSKTDVPDSFGFKSIPSIFLIGPDGEIIEKKLRGRAIEAAVEKALRRPAD